MEPERHIEKLLQALAKKRREQAGQPFELHPVARQELLREASRRAAKKSGGGFFAQIFSGFGPRLAVALSAVAIVVIGIWVVRPLLNEKKETSTLAMADRPAERHAEKNEPAPALAPPPESAAPPVAGSAGAAREETATPAAEARRSSGEVAAKTKSPNATPPTIAVNSESARKDEANRTPTAAVESPKQVAAVQPNSALDDLSKSTVAVATPVSPPAATYKNTPAANSFASANTADKAPSSTTPSLATNAVADMTTLAAADRETQKEVNVVTASTSVNSSQTMNFDGAANSQAAEKLVPVSQHFYRVVAVPTVRQRGFGGGSAVPPLLASFRMEQNGQEIRVVDADGSVYTGSWQVAPEQNSLPAPAGRTGGLNFSGAIPAASSVRPAPAAENNFQALLNYSFRVSGTNRNLKERITFSGNFIPLSNLSNTANNAGATGGLAGGRNTTTFNAAPPVFLNSRIAGKAIIGDNREIEVNANPVP
jgi:hypothetical protein